MSELYDRIGINYDSTRSCDPFILSRLISFLNVPLNSKVIDIGCGTGNYSIALCNAGYDVTGVDVSLEMLGSAKAKNSNVNWLHGDVEHIPISSNYFDGCICTLACHHFHELEKAFLEVYRVLKEGRLVILTCSHRQIRHYWLYRYFPDVLETITTYMPDIDILINCLCSIGFKLKSVEPYYITTTLKDNFLGARFEEPEMYLDADFRNGMSIFADKANKDFVNIGCAKLHDEINSGFYQTYIKDYKNNYGDYLFLTVEKA